METKTFNGITRNLGSSLNRRSALRGLFAGAAAAVARGALLQDEDASAKRRKKKGKGKGKGNGGQQAICQPGTQIGAVSVPATGVSVNTPVLVAGQRYRLRASGFWASNATNGQDAFADFPFADPTKFTTTFEGVRLGLSVNGGSPDQWGSYNTGHVYEQVVVGQGAALSLRCSDAVFTDNSGSVLVEILCA